MNSALFCWKTKNHNLQDVVNVEKQDWNEAGGRPFAGLWSLWSHTKSNRPLIWWLRPWKSSPPNEEDVRGRAWSFSRQREGSFTSQHQDVWIKDKPSGNCHILQAYTATCQQRFFRLSGNFNSYIGFHGLKLYKWISAGHILSGVSFTFPTGPDCRDVATCGLRARFCGSHLAWEFAEAFFRHRSVVLGTLETVLCPSLSRVYSVYSLNSKLMVMTMMGFYLFLWGQEMTPMFVSHIFGPFPASVFLVGSFINPIPPKPSITYPTYGVVYQRPSVLLEEQPPPSHLPALPPVPSQVAKEAAVPWLKVSECVVCCLTAMNCTVACPSLSAVHDSKPSPPIDSQQLRYRVSEFVQLGDWMGM